MNLTITSKVGKKFALYIPKRIVKALKIKEGDKIRIYVKEGRMIVEIIKDPLELALKGKKFAKISTEEVEQISLKEQKKHENFA